MKKLVLNVIPVLGLCVALLSNDGCNNTENSTPSPLENQLTANTWVFTTNIYKEFNCDGTLRETDVTEIANASIHSYPKMEVTFNDDNTAFILNRDGSTIEFEWSLQNDQLYYHYTSGAVVVGLGVSFVNQNQLMISNGEYNDCSSSNELNGLITTVDEIYVAK